MPVTSALALSTFTRRIGSRPYAAFTISRPMAPWPRASGPEVEPEEAVEDSCNSAVQRGPKTLRSVELKVRHRHLTGQEKRDRASEKSEEKQRTADQLEDAAGPDLGHQRRSTAGRRDPCRKGEEYCRARQDEHGCGHDAQHAHEIRRPGRRCRNKAR